MKKVILTIIIALSVIMSISAHDFSVNGIYYNILSGEDLTCEVTFRGYTCNEYDEYIGHFSIPEQVTYNSKVYNVVAIGNQAFHGNYGLTSISIPNTIKTIGTNALSCTYLKSVTIPESVTSVGEYAFVECDNLTTVYFNAIDCPKMGSINYTAFKGCDKLTNVYFGKKVKIIPDYGFINCTGLTSVTIPDSVTTIGRWAFEACTNLKSVNMGNSVINISGRAFSECNSLLSITLPITLKLIGDYAFFNCDKLTTVTIPESVDSIGERVFQSCNGLKSVNYNAKNCIGEFIFGNCEALQTVIFGDSVQIIPANCFCECSSLTSLSIPESVTTIGNGAFMNCTSLETINLNAIECIRMGNTSYPALEGCIALTTVNFGDNVKMIPGNAFRDCDGITSIVLPESLNEIKAYAFTDCDGLLYVNIPDKVLRIGDQAFMDCSNVCSLTVGASVKSVGISAFYGAKKVMWKSSTPPLGYQNTVSSTTVNIVPNNNYISLKNILVYPYLSSMFEVDGIKYVPVNISERKCDVIDCLYDTTTTNVMITPTIVYNGIEMKLNTISEYAFYWNKFIEEVDIKFDGNIGDKAFVNCVSLERVKINVPIIENSVFYSCENLSNVIIGDNVESIGVSSFHGCWDLSVLSIGEKVKTIGDNAFRDCYALKEVVLGKNVESIGDFAFSNCTGLESFEFGLNMKNIGSQAFAACTSLVKFRSKALTPPTCGELALDDINKWNCELMVPDASIPLYQAADQWKDFFYIVPDGIEDVKVDNNAVEVYRCDINGRLLDGPIKGVNIVKMSDGTVLKVCITE